MHVKIKMTIRDTWASAFELCRHLKINPHSPGMNHNQSPSDDILLVLSGALYTIVVYVVFLQFSSLFMNLISHTFIFHPSSPRWSIHVSSRRHFLFQISNKSFLSDLPLVIFQEKFGQSSSWSGFMWAGAFIATLHFGQKSIISWEKVSLYMKICRPTLTFCNSAWPDKIGICTTYAILDNKYSMHSLWNDKDFQKIKCDWHPTEGGHRLQGFSI